MDCGKIKKLIPVFLDGELDAVTQQRVESHLDTCAACRAEARSIHSAWELLDELDEIKPDPNYQSRFWATVAKQTSWRQNMMNDVKALFWNRRLIPALAAAGLILCVTLVGVYNYLQPPRINGGLAEIIDADFDLVDNIDLAENFDLIREIDLLTDMEIIEELDEMDAS